MPLGSELNHKSNATSSIYVIFHKQTIAIDGVDCLVIASLVAAMLTCQSQCVAKIAESDQILLLSAASRWPFISLN
jgi:hypothetical protein